ncbi:CRISPR-associated helicase/endonuclease Cas3 [Virgisporangium aliadipatigenens]|uniref:CRISPR-associated helicase/endonuclease Cas3 n=1 Tax=Virgisporangium aliadipatigenens TaxID=741659 RepID=A0A8J4DVB0_9ACTN|nr:CRISPR-associated helicase Cas3' [Virgisporangium aliadipatigenens]GIJ52210.1 CRISPR-associated helicase/endonuclease Cas3 [Virgisporangium aliadipatigenens]
MSPSAGPPLSEATRCVWGKTDRSGTSPVGWLPLWRHLADTADVAGRLWDDWLSAAVRRRISDPLPGGEADGRTLAVWLAGIHDIGKATPAFAIQAPHLAARMHEHGLRYKADEIRAERRLAPHATAGHHILAGWLQRHGWPDPHPVAVIVGGHHGLPPTDIQLRDVQLRPYLCGDSAWKDTQNELLAWMSDRCGAAARLTAWRDIALPQPVQALLTGLVIVADWIASNEKYFPYLLDTSDADRLRAGWDELDLPLPWLPGPPPSDVDTLFAARFSLPTGAVPRPVQRVVTQLAETMPTPGMLIIEAAMGEGKTEAAMAAVEILARRTGLSGCYLALPTRATSDAMFARMLAWLQRLPDARTDRCHRDVRLAHGKAALNADYDTLRHTSLPSNIAADEGGTAIGVHTWLAGRKRTLLSNFVAGTIDQLLFAALRGKHLVLRHLGLAGKVVVIDEAHAYDVYMAQFLERAIEWLASFHVPVVVLSATLPAGRRAALFAAYDRGRLGAPPKPSWRDRGRTAADPYAALRTDLRYPLVSVSAARRGALAHACDDSGRATDVRLLPLDDEASTLALLLREHLVDGGCALIVRNTVARVQETAAALRAALGPDTPVTVAHSRFMAVDRAAKDQWLRDTFGPPATGTRPHRHIVVASQVAEQSLDIDFDLLVTDLAPVDLMLQRIGRLHRHPRHDRPALLRTATCWVTGADWSVQPPQPVRGSRLVYEPATLLRSAAVLQTHLAGAPLRLPADIAPLTHAAYSEAPPGPPHWKPAIDTADAAMRERQTTKQAKANGFRLAEPAEPGTPLIGWLTGGVGDTDDRAAQGHVRDTDTESLEVILLVRTADGLVLPPWTDKGGEAVTTTTAPCWSLQRRVAGCTLPLPRTMTDPDVIDEVIAALEQRIDLRAWQDSPWLAGELVLDIDSAGNARVAGFDLHYDPEEGLRVSRSDSAESASRQRRNEGESQ